MNISTKTLNSWWMGNFRTIARPILRRMAPDKGTISNGALKGKKFPVPDHQILLGFYEIHVVDLLSRYLKEGSCFFDIGANYGYISLFASQRVGPKGEVYAFEPLPINLETIYTVIKMNNLHNIKVIEKAVSKTTGNLKFYVGGSTATSSLMKRDDNKLLTVPSISLDDLSLTARIPDFIKIDVEGAETMVLEGAANLLAGKKLKCLLIEIHDKENDLSVNKILISNGYNVRKMDFSSKHHKLYPHHILAEA